MRGKYSPVLHLIDEDQDYNRNAYGEIPPEFSGPEDYDQKIHFGNYNSLGYDYYGYSAWNNGSYLPNSGRDAMGYTEDDYLNMSVEDFNELDIRSTDIKPVMTDRGPIGNLER